MRELTAVVGALVMLLTPLAAEATAEAMAPSVVLVSVDSVALRGGWHWSCCGRRWATGHGIAEMVGGELRRRLRDGEATVITGAVLRERLMAQRLHDHDDLSIATAARIARELSADLAVIGRVQVFEAFRIARFLEGGDWAQARVTLRAQVIDARSGVVVGEQSATAYQVRSVPPWDIGNRPRTDIGGARFRYTLLGRTTSDAARSLADRLRREVRTLTASGAWQSWEGPAVVGSGRGNLTINRGADDGVMVGDVFDIMRGEGERGTQNLGTLTIEDARASLAIGRIDRRENGPRPRPGDRAKPVMR